MSQPIQGWGAQAWGSSGWGGNVSSFVAALELLTAEAIVENQVLLTFNSPVNLTGVLDPTDAANPANYSIVIAPNSALGSDGLPIRNVLPFEIDYNEDAFGNDILNQLVVTLDRNMSPYPAQYVITVNNLLTLGTLQPLVPGFTSLQYFAIFRELVIPHPQQANPSRDIANPQTVAALIGLPQPVQGQLGTLAIDETGDYITDTGINNIKKRVYRRLFTQPGRFSHLPNYGVGVQLYGKKLNLAAVRVAIAAAAEAQIKQEPDVADCSVTVESVPNTPEMVKFFIQVKTTTGSTVPIPIPFSLT